MEQLIEKFIVKHNLSACHFEVDFEGDQAVLIYMIKADLFVLLHTWVPDQFRGRGIAAMIAKAAFEYARENNYKVRSYCSYTSRYLERHPEYKELEG
jgi:predicted GNAT family acetyltransferase